MWCLLVLAMIEGADPRNEVQAALAIQMALTHAVAQTVLLRAARVDQIPQFDSASNSAVKLLRTFAIQAEVLAKLQRGGEQVVKVVHMHPGAQAIVGNMMTANEGPLGGGGGADEKWNQPHAKAKLPASQFERLPEMLCQDTERQPMPFAVGQAVRRVAGCMAGQSGAVLLQASATVHTATVTFTREAIAERMMVAVLVLELRALTKSLKSEK